MKVGESNRGAGLPRRVVMFGGGPPVLGIFQFLGDGCGIEVQRYPTLPSPRTGQYQPPALAANPVVIHCNDNPGALRVLNAIDALRVRSEWMAAYLCIVPDERWARRVSDELEAAGVDTGPGCAHRVLPHPVPLAQLLGTLAEMREPMIGVDNWIELRNGMPHQKLLHWLTRWRDGAATTPSQSVADLLQQTTPALFFSHEIADRLAALQEESRRLPTNTRNAEADLARRLFDCLSGILE